MPSRWWQKGKQRAYAGTTQSRQRRDDSTGTGDGDGAVVPLQYVGTTAYDAAYTLPIIIGSNNLNVSLQIDTGSSDLWVTASSCSSCGNVPSDKRYDPSASSSSLQSGTSFNLTYLQGQALGSIDWDSVDIGGYTIGVASTVNSEPLSEDFNGVIGLALPDNSVISGIITPTSSNAPDGAQFTSNLFSLSPSSLTPAARFLSLTLSRPGSSTIPSLFGIGKHPSQSQIPMIGNGSNVQYKTPLDSLTPTGVASLFWKSNIEDITVWVDGQAKPIALQNSSSNYPTAILDTGVPVILATKSIADAIYGAIGVSPASDGNYYVSCTTPLNLTISLDGRSPISVHPLDLTTPPPSTSSSSNCIGLIQAVDSGVADMILGVPFIRNTYMVMAYQNPYPNGSFPDVRPGNTPQSPMDSAISSELYPSLGLQGLTNATVALEEFQKVRVLGLPIDGSQTVIKGGKKISTGLDILFGLIGFFGLCFLLFGIRFCIMKRKYPNSGGSVDGHGPSLRSFGDAPAAGGGLFSKFRPKKSRPSPYISDNKDLGIYELAARTSPTADAFPSADVLREFEIRRRYTVNSDRTRVGDVEEGEDSEMGWKKKVGGGGNGDAFDGLSTMRTLSPQHSSKHHEKNSSQGTARDFSQSPERRPMMHRRESSGDTNGSRSSPLRVDDLPGGHSRGPSLSFPLLQLPETALTHDTTSHVDETALGLDLGDFSDPMPSTLGVERPSSSLSSGSERGRPARMPSGPRQSTLSSSSSSSIP
ncbi:acid protease [Gymnopus androsaceus JB14]|uniref:Acid protease n=1 Tax=Gymnopus androsaceus JB14 TaxID=1447944 RepID=A0A6A4HAD7_9AGAR|nr:acid protease [Gymnopus androsaceus JB14]